MCKTIVQTDKLWWNTKKNILFHKRKKSVQTFPTLSSKKWSLPYVLYLTAAFISLKMVKIILFGNTDI